jgi:hypothetical protein
MVMAVMSRDRWASWSVILSCALLRASKGDGPTVADSSFEARPAVQLHRKARTSSDNGFAVARG